MALKTENGIEDQLQRNLKERVQYLAAFFVVILFNYLANALPLGGRTTGELSDLHFSMFTPAGFTFAIWGVIYLSLFGFIVRQFLERGSISQSLAQIRIPFYINCLANSAWIVAWHYNQLLLSMFIMVIILVTLFQINEIISSDATFGKGWDQVLVTFPFQIYFGWICVATIANASVLQAAFGFNDFIISQALWTIGKLIVASLIGYFWGWKPARPYFLFVLSWASFGISVSNSTQYAIELTSQIIAVGALISGILILIGLSPHNKRMLRARTI